MKLDNKISSTGLVIWLVCTAYFLYEFMLRTIVGTFQHPLTYDLHLTQLQFTLISSTTYQIIYGLMQLPVGYLIERLGLKIALFTGTLACVIATFGFASSQYFIATLCFRILMGFGSAFGFICLLTAIYEWMPQRSFAFYIGISSFLGTMGPMLSAAPIQALSEMPGMHWRIIFLYLCGIAVVLSILTLLFVRNNLEQPQRHSFKLIQPQVSIWHTFKNILAQKDIWFIAIFCGCSFFTIEYLSENEGRQYLYLHHYSEQFSSRMISLAWFCYALSCPILGWLSDKIKRRKTPLTISAIANFLGILLVIYFPVNHWVVMLGFMLLGIGASGSSIGFAALAEFCKPHEVPLVMGFNNTILMLVCAFNAPLIAEALTIMNHGTTTTAQIILNYKFAFLLCILFAILALFLILYKIQETYCKTQRGLTILE